MHSRSCQFCNFEGSPYVETRVSQTGWILFVVLLLVCLPLCWLPFVVSSLKEEVYRCPSCGAIQAVTPMR